MTRSCPFGAKLLRIACRVRWNCLRTVAGGVAQARNRDPMKKHLATVTAAVVTTALFAAPSAHAWPGYQAIFASESSPQKWGAVGEQPNPAAAEAQARHACESTGATDCSVFASGILCVALVYDPVSTHAAGGYGPTRSSATDDARRRAYFVGAVTDGDVLVFKC